MSAKNDPRLFVQRALEQQGSIAPRQYVQLLEQTPPNRVIENLDPWAFLPTPERSQTYCSESLGRSVLPFAQAIEEDMIACFEVEPSSDPAVVVINPWAQSEGEWVKSDVEIKCLPNFDTWLVYAKWISDNVRERDRQEQEDGSSGV